MISRIIFILFSIIIFSCKSNNNKQSIDLYGVDFSYDSIESISNIMTAVDQILVMSVVPGSGGQSFIPESLKKISTLSSQIKSQGLSISIQVDGGINSNTVADAVKSGANILVAGSAVFNPSFSICDGLAKLRSID